MNDKKLNELIAALSTTEGGNKALQGLKDKIAELDEASLGYDKSKAAHKKEFLALSKERTKLEVVKDEIEVKEDKALVNLQLSIDVLKGNETKAAETAQKLIDLDAIEKKTRASCRRKETVCETRPYP